MAKVLIIYHSRTGNTEEMAKAVAEGAESIEGVEVIQKKVAEASVDDFLSCDAVAFGSPTNFNYMAGALKEFFDQSFPKMRGKVTGKPYVDFVNFMYSGKEALDAIENICNAFELKKATDGATIKGLPSPEALTKCWDIGNKLAKMAAK